VDEECSPGNDVYQVGIVYVWEEELEWMMEEREWCGVVVVETKEIGRGYRRRLFLHKLLELRWEQR
jgi:hypothetical protein